MNAVPDDRTEAGIASSIAQVGALPDAPLAMPKQRLETAGPLDRVWLTGVLRPLLARTGRSGG